jgi:endoglucanase
MILRDLEHFMNPAKLLARAGILSLCVLITSTVFAQAQPSTQPGGPPPELKVVGTKLQTMDGKVVVLQGVNIPSLEYTVEGENVLPNIAVAIDSWKSRMIRLPMSQDNWFGKYAGSGNHPAQTDGGEAYRKLIDDCVNLCSSKDAYILLDLHWSDANDWTRPAAQRFMPDEHSLMFWKEVAAKYANNPAVMFDLYNEPHQISWEIWRNGGPVNERAGRGGGGRGGRQGGRRGGAATQAGATTLPATTPAAEPGAVTDNGPARSGNNAISYNAVGLQTLLEAVRATGAKNVIVAGGVDYAYDLRGIANGFALEEKGGNGIMYATHIYPWKHNWDANVGVCLDKYCVYVGEFGAEIPSSARRGDEDPYTWVPEVLGYIQKNQLSWTAWSFHSRVHPFLFTDDSTYVPSPHWGSFVKSALMGVQFQMDGKPR